MSTGCFYLTVIATTHPLADKGVRNRFDERTALQVKGVTMSPVTSLWCYWLGAAGRNRIWKTSSFAAQKL